MLISKCLEGGNRRAGVASVELALIAPLLCFLFVLAIDYSRIFYFTMVVTNCARNGAIYGMQTTKTANDASGIAAAAAMDAGNLNVQQLSVTSSTDSDTSASYVIVTVAYPFSTLSNFPGISSTTTISRTVRLLVPPLTPVD
jgi:Flp pilus assembly protein TadG